MNRRSFLLLAGGVIAGGAGVAGSTGQLPSNVQGKVDSAINETFEREEPNPYVQTFSSPLVSKIEFNGLGEMTISLGDSHGSTCIGIWHDVDDTESRDPIIERGCSVMSSGLPRYGGEVTVDMVGTIEEAGVAFPSRYFKIVGFDGKIVRGRTAKVVFFVPADLMPEGSLIE